MPRQETDTLLRISFYPLLLIAGLAGTYLLLPALEPMWVIGIVNVSGALLILLVEERIPYRGEWGESRGDTPTDLGYLALSLAGLVLAAPLMTAITGFSLWLRAELDVGLWPHALPLPAQVLLALMIYELGSYGLHWLSHHTWLWRIHAVHHSVERLYWLNSMRSHPVDYIMAVATTSGPLLLMGVSETVFAYVTVLGVLNMMLQHTNADLRTGPLDWIFITPRIHRWHHSSEAAEQQRNLGAILVVYDVLFGSRLAPVAQAPPSQVGAGVSADYPKTLGGQLLSPFRRALWAPSSDSENLPAED